MSNQVKVMRDLSFIDFAATNQNIKGAMNPSKRFQEYSFRELALDNTNRYTPFIDTTSAVALGSGGLVFTTAATDTKTASETFGGIGLYPVNNPIVEFKFKIDVITNAAIFAGLTDAVSEASGLLPFGLAVATLTDTASDAAGLLWDTRQTLAYFNIVNTKAGTEAFTQLPATIVPVAGTDLTIRVAIDSAGNALYYFNGVCVGYKASAVTTTVPLVPYFGIRNNTASAHVATLRYVRVWDNA